MYTRIDVAVREHRGEKPYVLVPLRSAAKRSQVRRTREAVAHALRTDEDRVVITWRYAQARGRHWDGHPAAVAQVRNRAFLNARSVAISY